MTPVARSSRTTCHMSLRSSTSTPAVGSSRNRIVGSCASALAISRRRFMPPDSVMILLSFLVPQRQRLQHLLDVGGVGRLAEEAAAERDGVPYGLEGVGGQLLRDEADHGAHAAVVASDVAAVDRHRARRGIDDAADDGDERRLAGAVGAEQREDLAAADVEVDILQGLEARSVRLRQVFDGDDGCHAAGMAARCCYGKVADMRPMSRR